MSGAGEQTGACQGRVSRQMSVIRCSSALELAALTVKAAAGHQAGLRRLGGSRPNANNLLSVSLLPQL